MFTDSSRRTLFLGNVMADPAVQKNNEKLRKAFYYFSISLV